MYVLAHKSPQLIMADRDNNTRVSGYSGISNFKFKVWIDLGKPSSKR